MPGTWGSLRPAALLSGRRFDSRRERGAVALIGFPGPIFCCPRVKTRDRARTKYGLEVDPAWQVASLSVGMQQRVRLIKGHRQPGEDPDPGRARIVPDPTAESRSSGVVIELAASGVSVFYISYSLDEGTAGLGPDPAFFAGGISSRRSVATPRHPTIWQRRWSADRVYPPWRSVTLGPVERTQDIFGSRHPSSRVTRPTARSGTSASKSGRRGPQIAGVEADRLL